MKLISIHIPKTAGTSFYSILSQVYGDQLSPSFKRRDINQLKQSKSWTPHSPALPYEVMHGHFRYGEIKPFLTPETQLICWLRDPIQRLVSNYHFFKTIFTNPQRNPANYERNKHRAEETLEEYASLLENQNRICEFLEGASLNTFTFIGHMDFFSADLDRLSHSMSWPVVQVPHRNRGPNEKRTPDQQLLEQLIKWNKDDITLYCQYLSHRGLAIPDVYNELLA